MIYWSTLTTSNSTENTSAKYYGNSEKTSYMLKLANANGTKIQSNSSVTSSEPKDSLWLKTKSKPSANGPNQGKSKTFSPSLASPISIVVLSSIIQTSQYPSLG